MGVAQYKVPPSLPSRLQQELPTIEEFRREFPLMSVIQPRIEIERALRDYAATNCDAGHQTGRGRCDRLSNAAKAASLCAGHVQ
jgi:hypothetical protein